MIFLLNGNNKYLIKKEINKIKLDNSIEDVDTITFDLTETIIDDVIEDASMMSMFGFKKLIIVENSEIFVSGDNTLEHNIDNFLAYIKNPNPDSIIIFIHNNEKLDERKKVTKRVKEIATFKTFNNNENINNMVKDMLLGFEINNSDLKFMIDRVGTNLNLLEKECEKLTLYKMKEKIITKEDIELLTNKNIDLDIFALIDYIITRNKDKSLELYYEMIKHGEEPIKLIIMIAGQIRLMYQTKELFKKGYTEKNIATTLGIHPYRVKLAGQKSRNYSEKKLIDTIKSLALLDENIKTGKADKINGLEMFILTL